VVRILEGAILEIGDGTFIYNDSSIFCKERVTIGSRCAISWNVNILDGNMHELTIDEVTWPKTVPVTIGDNVWIGTNVTIVGATIGNGAVIGGCTMLTSAVPDKALVTGIPAQLVAKDVDWVF
jgi:acetyltransferase-like isoleucine patch superfamily enzyme